MGVQLANAQLSVNNEPISYAPNTLNYTEGFGEQTVRAASAGGGQVEQIYSRNIETSFSKVNFEMPATIPNINLARQWKANTNQNVVSIVGETPEGTLTRTFTQASLLTDYEVSLVSEGNIVIEFNANPAV